jgi:ABC-type polar amino acid transport system ATPase subunit
VEDGLGMSAVLTLDNVRLERGARTVLNDVSFEVAGRELVAIMGPSGSGKTTVLRAVAGLEPFSAGRIVVGRVALERDGANDPSALQRLRREVGMVFQFHCLFDHLSAIDNVCLAPVHAHGMAASDAERRGRELLRAFGVEARAGAYPRELSGGEAQRVAIARALAVDPPLLLMDEPTASLDPARRTELGHLLRGLLEQGRTLVVATHDEDFANQFATRTIRIENGRITNR